MIAIKIAKNIRVLKIDYKEMPINRKLVLFMLARFEDINAMEIKFIPINIS